MSSNCGKTAATIFGTIGFCLLLLLPGSGSAQADGAAARSLVVGALQAPPVMMKAADGRWSGIGIEIWENVARRMGLAFEYREFVAFGLLVDALETKTIDLIPSLPVELRYESAIDFSQSYFKSGLAIAVPAESGGFRWIRLIGALFSREILGAIVLLLFLSVVAGILVWLFERRRNSEMFGGGAVSGVGNGVWWSVVTMSTVGYGDKAPKTAGGRLVAILWMFFSIALIASFTANITTSLTIEELRGKVRGISDLKRARVGTIPQSEALHFLNRGGIAVVPFEGIPQGLRAVVEGKIDAFVLNELMLKYQVKNDFQGRVRVLPDVFDEYFVAMALQEKTPLRKPVNKALLSFMKTPEWVELQNRYAP
ncbi:MAG: transporter substrate-binding domain-containing protein [Desulfobacterales bacterium]